MQATRKVLKDYREYAENPWRIWDVIYSRRSHRKYDPSEISFDEVRGIERSIELFSETRGAHIEDFKVITETRAVRELKNSVYRGYRNRINTWLSKTHPVGFLAVVVEKTELSLARPSRLARDSMVCEDAVLYLTEKGFGTCWLGGVNEGAFKRAVGLEPGMSVPYIICFGKPAASRGFGYNNITFHMLTRRRKPFSSIAFLEKLGTPFLISNSDISSFYVSDVQDISGLSLKMKENRWEAIEPPLLLAVEASLEAGRLAPSAGNSQPWRFVLVRNREKLASLLSACGMSGDYRAAIVAAAEMRTMESRLFEKPFWMIDVPIAISHISLLLASMECPSDIAIESFDEGFVNELVGARPGVRTAAVVFVR